MCVCVCGLCVWVCGCVGVWYVCKCVCVQYRTVQVVYYSCGLLNKRCQSRSQSECMVAVECAPVPREHYAVHVYVIVWCLQH